MMVEAFLRRWATAGESRMPRGEGDAGGAQATFSLVPYAAWDRPLNTFWGNTARALLYAGGRRWTVPPALVCYAGPGRGTDVKGLWRWSVGERRYIA